MTAWICSVVAVLSMTTSMGGPPFPWPPGGQGAKKSGPWKNVPTARHKTARDRGLGLPTVPEDGDRCDETRTFDRRDQPLGPMHQRHCHTASKFAVTFVRILKTLCLSFIQNHAKREKDALSSAFFRCSGEFETV
jgi:hypothetical protein